MDMLPIGLTDKEIILEQRKIIIEQQKTIDRLELMVSNLLIRVEVLENENKELRARLNKNSNNSSKPPSTDGYAKKNISNNRRPSTRKTGGQEGHEGNTLLKVENPDIIIDLKLPQTCECGSDLSECEDTRKARQVFDLPPFPQITVTEYISHERTCQKCGRVHSSEFPNKVTQPVQYGDHIKSIMSYFTTYQLIPLERTIELIEDILGQKLSQGTLVNVNTKLFKVLEMPVEAIKQQIIEAAVVNFDESGLRSEGSTKWVHVASTEKLTYYAVHDKRGQIAATDIGILPEFEGTAVHDHWKPYYTFKNCTHAECNSHNLRYLREIYENFKQDWAQTMASLLIEIKDKVLSITAEGRSSMENDEIISWLNRYHIIINAGIAEDATKNPYKYSEKTGKLIKGKALNLLEKLKEYDIETLAFMFDFDVPFDNNLAERDIRMQKLRQKISGCFRGSEGAKVFCRIRSYISTARKNGVSAWDAIKCAFSGNPFVPNSNSI